MNSDAPTLEDVAREAGVSRSTASRAINGGLRVSPEARIAVEEAVARLGYTPNRAARSLVTRRTDSIALVVPEPGTRVLTDPFLAGLLRGTTSAIAHTDLQLVILLNEKGGAPTRIAQYLAGGHVDGAVIASHHERHLLEDAVSRADLPAVFVGRPFGTTPRHYVDLDNVAGGRLAARRLVDRGCRRIGTITGPLDLSAGLDRLRGWREVLEEAGLPADAVVEGDFGAESGAAGAERLLGTPADVGGVGQHRGDVLDARGEALLDGQVHAPSKPGYQFRELYPARRAQTGAGRAHHRRAPGRARRLGPCPP